MSERLKSRINWWVECIYKVGTPLGLAALWYLKVTYVTKEEFLIACNAQTAVTTSIKTDISTIQTTLLLMAEQNKVNERQDALLKEHSESLHSIEVTLTDHIARNTK